MAHRRFQTEPPQPDAAHTLRVSDGEMSREDSDTRPALESLLLGLHFRDWITESDRRFLTNLAPTIGRIMLMSGDRRLFPSDAAQMPPCDFAPSALHLPDAVFTHHGRMSDSESSPCEIHTAMIGRIGGRDLVLGVARPDRLWDRSSRVPGFEPVIAQWREALRTASTTFAQLSARLSSDNPYLIINRASGRVVAVKDQLCHLLGSDAGAVIDAEYSTVAGRLRQVINSRGLHLENVTIGETHLAVVTLLPERRRKARGGDDNFFSEFFVHAMRNKLSVIATASSQLECLSGDEGTSDRQKLAAMIVAETGELERLIDGLDLLTASKRRPDRTVSVADELGGAARLTRARLNRPVTVVSDLSPETATVTASGTTLTTLAEAVLRSHTVHGAGASSRIRVHEEEDSLVVQVATLLDGAQKAGFHPHWQTYASRLADKLGFACSHQTLDNGNLTTTISIPVEGKPAHV